jgi:hypothetical protein
VVPQRRSLQRASNRCGSAQSAHGAREADGGQRQRSIQGVKDIDSTFSLITSRHHLHFIFDFDFIFDFSISSLYFYFYLFLNSELSQD